MNRLRHTDAGQLRLMQISSAQLFVFVEGKQSDAYCYAKICMTIPMGDVSYEICAAQQLPKAAGGKQALIAFFSYLRKIKSLTSALAGKKTTCIFFVDKDLDDLQNKKKRSPHIVYTEHNDIQNYIYLHGNLLNGAASAASIDPSLLHDDLSDATTWCFRVASYWKDWLSLCIRIIEDRIPDEGNYRVLSPVQTRLCGPTDPRKHDDLTDALARKSGLTVAEFRQQLTAASQTVNEYFIKRRHHRIFKGKWFASILADEIDRIMAEAPYDNNRLPNRLTSTIAATIDFTESWADNFRNPLIRLIAGL